MLRRPLRALALALALLTPIAPAPASAAGTTYHGTYALSPTAREVHYAYDGVLRGYCWVEEWRYYAYGGIWYCTWAGMKDCQYR